MPQAIAIPIAGWVASIGVSAAVASFVGTVVAGAIVGAAVGGITAAVMGGDIGKGLLFGAIGGAVMGGISGAMGGGAGGTGAGASGATLEGATAGELARSGLSQGAQEATRSVLTEGAKSSAFGIGKFFASEGGGTIGAGLVTTAGTTLAGAFDDTAEEAAKLEREKMAQQDKQFYANLEAQKDIAGMSGGGGGGGSDAIGVARINQETQREQLAEQRRQYDVEKSLAEESRKRRSASVSALSQTREASPGGVNEPGIDEQMYAKSTKMYAEPTTIATAEEKGALSYA
jgi:hypothetical protein